MTEITRLSALKPGEKGWITGFELTEDMRIRLQDMGFEEGAHIECIYKSPFGDPTAYSVKGTVIAIRGEDSRQIAVECEAGNCYGA